MAFIIGFVIILALVLTIGFGVLIVYAAYFALLVMGGAAIGLFLMFMVGFMDASQKGDYQILSLAIVLSIIVGMICWALYRHAKEEERQEAERKVKEAAEKRARENAERRLRAAQLAKAGPIERWLRNLID